MANLDLLFDHDAARFQSPPEEFRHQLRRIGDGNGVGILSRIDGNLAPNVQLHRTWQALQGIFFLRARSTRHDSILQPEVIRHRVQAHAGLVAGFRRRFDMQRQQVVVECQRRDGRTVAPLKIVGSPVRREGFPNKVTVVGNERSARPRALRGP